MASSMVDAPASSAVAVTPSDSTNFAFEAKALFVGTAGNVVVVMRDGVACTFTNVQAGQILPVRCTRVNSTNTTASNIVALYG